MIYATACYLTSGGKTLFLFRNRGQEDIHDGFYVPPGGKNEPGERSLDCIIREFQQETGLLLEQPRLRAIVTFDNHGRIMGGKENPEDQCVFFYAATQYSGSLKAEHEKAQPQWIRDEDVPHLIMHPADYKILEVLQKEGIFEVVVRYNKKDLKDFSYTKVS